MMIKVVINRCHGGFGLSPLAQKKYLELIGKECYFYKQTKYEHCDGIEEYVRTSMKEAAKSSFVYTVTKDLGKTINTIPNDDFWYDGNLERTDPMLIKVVEELGKKASDRLADLEVVSIPDDIAWTIEDYDGYESIHEQHRSW